MKSFNTRAFELTTPARRATSESEPHANVRRPRQFYYERLMQVLIRHSFYNASRDECADFDITPTPTTATLMYDLGLIFRYERTGFSVLYDETRTDILFNYLARQEEPLASSPSKGGCWARLSFVLALNNPYFVNFTDVPIDVHPPNQNFYFTNQKAHEGKGGGIILTPKERVDEDDLLPVVSTQLALQLPHNVKKVLVLDISGDIVIDKDVCSQASPPERHADEETPCIVYLDFSLLPEDKYTIEMIETDATEGGARADAAGDLKSLEVLYTAAAPVPLCFIDLLFTNPTGSEPGIYPVRQFSSPPLVVPVQYELRFETRSTFWNYYVVPQPRMEAFDELRIESVSSSPPIEFAGPCCVTLTNGARAYLFSSNERLSLRQQSEYHFRLLGRRGLMTQEGILIERLPVPSIRQVLPFDTAVACKRLRQSLCPDAGAGERCRELVKLFCPKSKAKRKAARRGSVRTPEINIYSDTYVYV